MQALKTTESGAVLRPLRVLATLIQEDLTHAQEAAEKAGLPYYRAAGEKLMEARAQLKPGEWAGWLRRHFSLSRTSAMRYMQLADIPDARRRAFGPTATLSDIVEPHREHHQPAWHEPVREIVDRVDTETLNLKREELKRDEERDAQRQLALQLIDIGYKVLAKTLHPDKGGSRAAMARLNAVRDRLKHCI